MGPGQGKGRRGRRKKVERGGVQACIDVETQSRRAAPRCAPLGSEIAGTGNKSSRKTNPSAVTNYGVVWDAMPRTENIGSNCSGSCYGESRHANSRPPINPLPLATTREPRGDELKRNLTNVDITRFLCCSSLLYSKANVDWM